jgi:hypothetical protein
MADIALSSAALKALFETGDIPTQQNFADAWTSFENIVDNKLLIGSDPAITAHAGGGQASAYQITKKFSLITTVATSGDSVKLPAALAGRSGTISNTAANSCNVFPASGDSFSNLGTNAAEALPGYYVLNYYCIDDGVWFFSIVANTGYSNSLVRTIASGSPIDFYMSLANTYVITALAENCSFNNPQAVFGSGQILNIFIKDNGTPRALTWDYQFGALAYDLPTKTSNGSEMFLQFIYNAVDETWYLIQLSNRSTTRPASYLYSARVFCSGGSIDDVTVIVPLSDFDPVWTYTATGILNVTLPSSWDFSKLVFRLTAGNALNSPSLFINDEDSPSPIHIQMTNPVGAPVSSGVFWFEVEYYGQ